MPFLIHSGSATNNSQTKSKHTCVHTHTPVYSQSCDLDELAQQLHSLRQWLALQDLSSDPVLHLAAPLQYQLEVEGAPSRLLSMEHITHKLHLFKHRNPVGTCSDFFLISALKGEADVENWNVCVCVLYVRFVWPRAHSWRAPSQTPPAGWPLPLHSCHGVCCHPGTSGSPQAGAANVYTQTHTPIRTLHTWWNYRVGLVLIWFLSTKQLHTVNLWYGNNMYCHSDSLRLDSFFSFFFFSPNCPFWVSLHPWYTQIPVLG